MISRSCITKREGDALDAIRTLLEREHCPPAVSDVARELGISRPAAYRLMQRLWKKGFIRWQPGAFRTVRLVGMHEDFGQSVLEIARLYDDGEEPSRIVDLTGCAPVFVGLVLRSYERWRAS